ncbi:MAG: hypothetical protein ACTJH9_12030 [Pseudoalteromonas sp.]|uniref:hypothetical protein n=1 Tax=unclassified Pseudoalteromonas TaxID=194690 RepID=UPI003F9750DB
MLNRLVVILFGASTLLSAGLSANDFSQFQINQGKGEFSQAKHFKFLKREIKSQGHFVIYKQQVYWHTRLPVSSELLLLPSAIYRRSDPEKSYQVLTKDKQINQLLAKLLSGQIDESDWDVTTLNAHCYKLIPLLSDVALLFASVELCAEDEVSRSIVITDQQNNETHITMQVISKELSQSDMDAVKLPR